MSVSRLERSILSGDDWRIPATTLHQAVLHETPGVLGRGIGQDFHELVAPVLRPLDERRQQVGQPGGRRRRQHCAQPPPVDAADPDDVAGEAQQIGQGPQHLVGREEQQPHAGQGIPKAVAGDVADVADAGPRDRQRRQACIVRVPARAPRRTGFPRSSWPA